MTLSDKSRLYIPLEIEQNHLNELISTNFKEISINSHDSITGIRLSGEDQRLTLEMSVKGRYNGIVWADFTPLIDNENKKIKLQGLQIKLKESGILTKGLNWILHSTIKSKIEELVQSQLDKNLNKLIQQFLDKDITVPLPQKMTALLLVNDVTVHDFKFKDQVVILNLESFGTLKLLSTDILTLASAKKK